MASEGYVGEWVCQVEGVVVSGFVKWKGGSEQVCQAEGAPMN